MKGSDIMARIKITTGMKVTAKEQLEKAYPIRQVMIDGICYMKNAWGKLMYRNYNVPNGRWRVCPGEVSNG